MEGYQAPATTKVANMLLYAKQKHIFAFETFTIDLQVNTQLAALWSDDPFDKDRTRSGSFFPASRVYSSIGLKCTIQMVVLLLFNRGEMLSFAFPFKDCEPSKSFVHLFHYVNSFIIYQK